MEYHNIDIWPIPEDQKPCYINEPWLIDGSLLDYYADSTKEKLQVPEGEKEHSCLCSAGSQSQSHFAQAGLADHSLWRG